MKTAEPETSAENVEEAAGISDWAQRAAAELPPFTADQIAAAAAMARKLDARLAAEPAETP